VKAIVLAAGYGTRMQSVIGDTPKALIEVGGQTILDHLYDNLVEAGLDIVIVTNDRYHDQFLGWQASRSANCELISDGSKMPEDRLGAIGDLRYAIERLGLTDDLLVTAADNLIPFPLRLFVRSFKQDPGLYIAVWKNHDLEDQQRRGVVTISDGIITEFREKPKKPSSLDAAAPLYILPRSLMPDIGTYLANGGNTDAPGHLMVYLTEHHPAHAWPMPEKMTDVGNPESYRRALE
jgi:glucose-1-phosphate thymidylyltransferase